ncbi:MAG TPA: arsinothricin resistance N-acetyltransferase ArsN1 family A [Methylomirabilota bacterium]|nr:arsinothricin resistance N-acetyltransferase ArsN1 family A [Methylomirabilota bacterium]
MTPPALRIRAATPGDAAAICRIYNQGIQDRVATLETEERTPEERAQWLGAHGPRHPVLVAEGDGGVVGWASLNVFNARRAYEHVADLSLYVDRACRGRGVGRQLLAALVARASDLGYHKLVLAAFPWNEAGMRAYARAGFREVGTYREQGRLDGRWVDTVVMEKIIEGPNAH